MRPIAKATRDSDYLLSPNSVTAIPFTQALVDNSGMFSLGSDTRITCKQTGVYLLEATVLFEEGTNAVGARRVSLRVNGTDTIGTEDQACINRGSEIQSTDLNLSTLYALTENDYVELMVYQDSPSDINLLSLSGNFPSLSVVFIL